MSDKVAVIASILKPVNDTRLYEKLGLSICETNKYRVNIIGFGVKNPPVRQGVEVHTLYRGKRLGFGRLLAPWKLFIKLLHLRPELLVVCTPELLVPAALYKLIFKSRLWYDVQENYQRNVQFQSPYPTLLKPCLRWAIWLVETATRPLVDQYLLAEQGYISELGFVKGKHLVLQNKFQPLKVSKQPRQSDATQLVFTGTVSRENGIIEAILLTVKLFRHQYPVKLTIVGQVPDKVLLGQIQEHINSFQGALIALIGGPDLVAHQTIMEYAGNADFALVTHQPNPSTENCIPTKIYEYLGLQVPMILQRHPLWESVVNPYNAALVVDFQNFQPHEVWKNMQETRFYTKIPGPEITWEQEALKLLEQL